MKFQNLISIVCALSLLMLNLMNVEAQPTPTTLPSSDSSILTQQPCRVPCWYNIIPGQSSAADVMTAVENIALLQSADQYFERATDGGNGVELNWRYSEDGSVGNQIGIKNGIVFGIRVEPRIQLTLQDILSLYGTPTAYTLSYDVGMQIAPLQAEFLLHLYYPSDGLIVYIQVHKGDALPSYILDPNSLGIAYSLYAPASSLSEFLQYITNYDAQTVEQQLIPNYFTLGFPNTGSLIVEPIVPGNAPVVEYDPIILSPTPSTITPSATPSPTLSPTPTATATSTAIPSLTPTPPATSTLRIEAESYTSAASGVTFGGTGDEGGGEAVYDFDSGRWIAFNNIDLLGGVVTFRLRADSPASGNLSLRLGSATAAPFCTLAWTPGGTYYTTRETTCSTPVSGVQTLYVTNDSVAWVNTNWIELELVAP
jgi:hypothetical protein